MSIHQQKEFRMLIMVLLAMGVTISAARADNDSGKYGGENRGKPLQLAQTNAKFQQECSTCHIAYSPGLLSAKSWRKVMTGLDKHFGSDASLSDQENREITAFLVNNASNRWSASAAPLRISEAAWFKHKHDGREINPAVWKNPQIKSPANCGACHPRAERGEYNERDIKIPK